jgi:transcription elongation factor GreA
MTTGNRFSSDITLGEAASHYLATVPEGDRNVQHQEINKFVRWFGGGRTVAGMNGAEVAVYAERLAQTDADAAVKIEPIKAFLAYVRKEKWNPENLAIGIKIKKGKSRNTGPSQKVKREPVPMTKAKYDELTAELASLRVKRVEVIGDIQRAAADKDFKENAPFHAAREQKGHIEGKIMEIDEMLASAVITDDQPREQAQTISVGDTVVLEAVANGQEMRYKIVNPKEVAPSKGMISTVSPIGKAVLGKKEGDVVGVAVPAGKLQYHIKKVER